MSDPHALFGQQCGLQRGPTSSTILNTVNGSFCYLYIIDIFPILNTITLQIMHSKTSNHACNYSYVPSLKSILVRRKRKVVCVVSCRLGLSVVTAPQESLIYMLHIGGTYQDNGCIHFIMRGGEDFINPTCSYKCIMRLAVTTWDYIFQSLSLFHFTLFVYSCDGTLILVCR